jgi:hypothetical protein
MKKQKRIKFKDFLERFPEVELPIALTEETHHTFSRHNKPLSEEMIAEFIEPHEQDERDEFTEYVPCFRLPEQQAFVGIVYWKAKLLDYNYMLMTFGLDGHFVKAYHISGLKTDGQKMAKLFCTINENLNIHLVAGTSDVTEKEYDASTSKAFIITINEQGTADIEMDENLIT